MGRPLTRWRLRPATTGYDRALAVRGPPNRPSFAVRQAVAQGLDSDQQFHNTRNVEG
jgi:hypothetical protein